MRVVVGMLAMVLVWSVGRADAAPTLAPGNAVTADVVNCSRSCWIGWPFPVVPNAWISPRRRLTFDDVDEKFDMVRSITNAHGDLNHNAAPSDAIVVADKKIVGTKAYVDITITRNLAADQYHGVYSVELHDKTVIHVPIDLRVRSGPLAPLLCIFVGLVLGFVLKWWNSSGKRKLETLAEIRRLELLVERDTTITQSILRPMVAELVDRIDRKVDAAKLDLIDADLAKVTKRRSQLLTLAQLESILGEGDERIEIIRDLVAIREDEAAATKLKELVDSLGASRTPASFAIKVHSSQPRPPAPTKRSLRSKAEKWVGPALNVATFLLLVYIGLELLYVDGVADFGARPLKDFLGLILWGLGSEIASRSLGTLGDMIARRTRAESPPPDTSADKKQDNKARETKPVSGLKLPEYEIDRGPLPFSTDAWPRNRLDRALLDKKQWTGKDTVIAVIDTGVEPNRTELAQARIIKPLEDIDGKDGLDQHGHGTCMVGLLASDVGLCQHAEILSIRALDENGAGTAAGLVKAIDIAIAKRVDVISISAGQPEDDAALQAAVKKAFDAGIVVVAAIRKEDPTSLAYPAAYNNAVGVTASKKNGHPLFSNTPHWVECGAPGQVVPTFDRAGPVTITGSSPAAALVAGVCALLLSSKPKSERGVLAKQLPRILRDASDTVDDGWVLVVRKAVEEVEKL